MSWLLSDRKIARLEALEERIQNTKLPPIFGQLENGDYFFYSDRCFIKIGPVLAREFGAEKYERMDQDAEIGW
jgi:hypothetical protein